MKKFILNEKSETIDLIKKELEKCDKYEFMISYIRESGLEKIIELLKKKNKGSRILTTTDGFVTSPKAMRMLLNNNINVKVYKKNNKKGFHIKAFSFLKNNKRTIINGSSNISMTAFHKNYELETYDIFNINNKENKEFKDIFKLLWNNEFSTELTNKFIDEYNLQYTINNKISNELENLRKKRINQINGFHPKGMQKRVLKKLQEDRRFKKTVSLISSATGTGKTYLAAFDAKEVNAKKILFIVHSRTILRKAKEVFKNIFPDFKTYDLYKNTNLLFNNNIIVFSTDKALNKWDLKQFYEFDYIIFDEAHKSGAHIQNNIFNNFQDNLKKGAFILGITATPYRTNEPRKLIEMFCGISSTINLKEALDKEWVAKFKAYALDSGVELSHKEIINLDKTKVITKAIDKSIEIDYWGKNEGKKIKGLIFVSRSQEAKFVSEFINKKYNKKKIYSKYISSSLRLKEEKIESLINNLEDENNILNFIITINKFNEGIDIPNLNTIIMMRPTESDIIYSQQIGRGLRIDEGKTKWLNVIDMVFNSQKGNDVMLNGLYDLKMTPTEKLNIISDWRNGNNPMLAQIDREAAFNIISRISRESYKTSYSENIKRKSIEKKGHLSILEMYNEINTENNFQRLIYSFKNNKKINSNSIPWIISAKSTYEKIESEKNESEKNKSEKKGMALNRGHDMNAINYI